MDGLSGTMSCEELGASGPDQESLKFDISKCPITVVSHLHGLLQASVKRMGTESYFISITGKPNTRTITDREEIQGQEFQTVLPRDLVSLQRQGHQNRVAREEDIRRMILAMQEGEGEPGMLQ